MKATKILCKVVDFLINETSEDVCQKCIYLKQDYEDLPDDVEPCFYKRTNGRKACRNGIIEYFQNEVEKEKEMY